MSVSLTSRRQLTLLQAQQDPAMKELRTHMIQSKAGQFRSDLNQHPRCARISKLLLAHVELHL